MNEANRVFNQVDFSCQDLNGSVFQHCQFYLCHFGHTDLREALFESCVFVEKGALEGCHFEYSDLRNARFKHCQLSLANFKGANCFGVEFRHCDMKGANFYQAQFANKISQKMYFCSAYITDCNLSYANFERQCIEKCDLFENKWIGANLLSASLKGSDLSRGVFSADVWEDFNLQECNLSHCELDGLDPRRVNLWGVTICDWQQETVLGSLGLIIMPD